MNIRSFFRCFSGRQSVNPNDPEFLFDRTALSDEQFVQLCYRFFLQRDADEEGFCHFIEKLNNGHSRAEIVQEIMQASEFDELKNKYNPLELPSLRKIRPEQYELCRQLDTDENALAFRVTSPTDYDWLEEMIVTHGYYDNIGAWNLEIDDDKKVIAGMAQLFQPGKSVELGCSTGSVVKLMREAGIAADGVEISHLAMSFAHRKIRPYIHFGDFRRLNLALDYDLIIGMDVFEHLNPNILGEYIVRCRELLGQGGYIFTNIPAYGNDIVFGEVHSLVFDEWKAQVSTGDNFSTLHVDSAGWPISGHLIWATSTWWLYQFETRGFRREVEIEKALHAKFDSYIEEKTPARKSFYVLSCGKPANSSEKILSLINGANR